jgi:hypothetical protein
MDFKYYDESDGMDPGLEVTTYDGSEYELYAFGERIGADDLADESDAALEDEEMLAEEERASAGGIEKGFGETLHPDNKDNLSDQIDDETLHEAAKSDYPAEEPKQPEENSR